MADEWTHQYKATRPCPLLGYGTTARITVTAGLHKLSGNQRAYFSVTAHVDKPGYAHNEAGGCMHTEIARYFPKLVPIIALHLSDETGKPMHAKANGWYQLAGYYGGAGVDYHTGNSERNFDLPGGKHEYRYPTDVECIHSFAEYVRIPLSVALDLAAVWGQHHTPVPSQTLRAIDPFATARERQADIRRDWAGVKAAYEAWIDTQGPRWQAEANDGIALLDRLISGGV